MSGWIADLSFGHDSVSGATLKARGCVGVIGYAGCTDSRKNATAENIADWEASGLAVYLVIENAPADLHSAAAGSAQGHALLDAAKALGYDYAAKPLFTGFDTNAGSGDYAPIKTGFDAFAAVVPIPGYYGDSDSIRYLHENGHPTAIFWQSESDSFSPEHPSPFAHLQQRYNDSRASGLAVDANDILKPFSLGADDMYDAAAEQRLMDRLDRLDQHLSGTDNSVYHGGTVAKDVEGYVATQLQYLYTALGGSPNSVFHGATATAADVNKAIATQQAALTTAVTQALTDVGVTVTEPVVEQALKATFAKLGQ